MLFLDRAVARRLVEEVKADAAALWRKLQALHEGRAHVALGYASWAEFCAVEFDLGKSHAYRLLDSARVHEAIEAHSPIGGQPVSERVARELVPVLRDDTAGHVAEVWSDVVDEHGNQPTAAQAREVVDRDYTRCPECGKRVRLDRPHDCPKWSRDDPARAVAALQRRKFAKLIFDLGAARDGLAGAKVDGALSIATDGEIAHWCRSLRGAAADLQLLADKLDSLGGGGAS